MISTAFLAAAVFLAEGPVAPLRIAQADAEREVRTIPLDDARARRVIRVRTAIGYPAVIEFPEAFAAPPVCGDCGDKGLFRLDVAEAQRYLTIKPRLFPGPQADGTVIAADEFLTTLTIRLEHYTLTFQVELAAEREKADARVVLTLPHRADESEFVRTEVAKAKAKMEAEYAGRLQAEVVTGFLKAISEPHHCSSSRARVREDDLVLEAQEVCFFGNAIYVRFTLENRGRVPVELGELVVGKGSGKNYAGVAEAQQYLTASEVAFQQTATGVVGFRLGDQEEPSTRYQLTVTERGGKHRRVTLTDISL